MSESAGADPHEDLRWMEAALNLGSRSLGLAAPNPAVGAILVKDGAVVGRGATAPGGRPHAERIAIGQAGEAARGATLYVTLEPCSHFGASPPCVDAVVAAGVARVVAALEDPNPLVGGQGHAQLRAAGIAVSVGAGAAQARRDHLGHILRVTAGRPCVTLKLAETADGFASAGSNDARLRITGPIADLRVQVMRSTHEAIMVGIERGHAWSAERLVGRNERDFVREPKRDQPRRHQRSALAEHAGDPADAERPQGLMEIDMALRIEGRALNHHAEVLKPPGCFVRRRRSCDHQRRRIPRRCGEPRAFGQAQMGVEDHPQRPAIEPIQPHGQGRIVA